MLNYSFYKIIILFFIKYKFAINNNKETIVLLFDYSYIIFIFFSFGLYNIYDMLMVIITNFNYDLIFQYLFAILKYQAFLLKKNNLKKYHSFLLNF